MPETLVPQILDALGLKTNTSSNKRRLESMKVAEKAAESVVKDLVIGEWFQTYMALEFGVLVYTRTDSRP